MTSWRWKAAGVSLVCFTVAGVVVWLAGADMARLLGDIAERRSVISSSPYCATGLILTPMVISVGLILLLGKQATPEEMKNASARTLKWSGVYFTFIAASIVAALLAPIPQHLIVGAIALGRGYVACPRPDWPRHQPDRWAKPGPGGALQYCPKPGADPNS